MLMAIDHIGVAVQGIEEYLRDFLLCVSQPIEVSPIIDDPHQGVSVCFVKYGGGCLELIQPLGHPSPIDEILARGRGGLYHVCWAAPVLAEAITLLENRGCITVGASTPAPAFGGRPVAFLVTPQYDLIEVVESSGETT